MVTIGECLGTRLATGRDGATFRLWPARVGATVRSQRELGRATAGLSGTASRKRATASAHGRDFRPSSDEVSGAGNTYQPGRLSRHGGGFCPTQVHLSASRAVVCRLARSLARDPATDSGTAGVVLESAVDGRAFVHLRGDPRSVTRSGDDCRPRATSAAAAEACSRRPRTDGERTVPASATPAGSRPGSTGSSGGENPARSQVRETTQTGTSRC